MKHNFWKVAWASLLVLLFLINGCTKDPLSTATDYSISEHWLALPAPSKAIDVFYVYPTAWYKVSDTEPNICAIDNAIMKQGSVAKYAKQATAFETFANVYAPYYRQADAVYTLSLSESERETVVRSTPLMDVTAAFDYYIQNFNNGRPFILAGHSQGANVLLFLLSDYMAEHPEVYKRMIAAYIIGYPVTAEFMAKYPHLRFAEGPDDTGVIISWNTQSPNVKPGANPVVSGNVGLVINPISWTRDETLATADEGLGSFMPDPLTGKFVKVPQYADAKIDKANGVLICSSADEQAMFKISGGMGLGVYHSFDIPFYYFNLRENGENRAEKFLPF